MIKTFFRKLLPNPLDQKLKKVKGGKKVLIFWNRGLGDIPLGLYALKSRITHFLPEAEITFVTREDLREGFKLLQGVHVLVDKKWRRGQEIDVEKTLSSLKLEKSSFDLFLEKPDPTRWLSWQLGKLTPRLTWKEPEDSLKKFGLDQGAYAAVHVQTETQYGYEKNWPIPSWKKLFKRLYEEKGIFSLLFGLQPTFSFEQEGVIDLRGQTTLIEMLAVIKTKCKYLIAPDSGILSMIYYLDTYFPITLVSLWADPHQGILRQNVPSPNSGLIHRPLFGKKEDISTISVDHVFNALFTHE